MRNKIRKILLLLTLFLALLTFKDIAYAEEQSLLIRRPSSFENPVEALRVAETNWIFTENTFGTYSNFEYFFSYTPSDEIKILSETFWGFELSHVYISFLSTIGDIWTTLINISFDGDTIPLEFVSNSIYNYFTFSLPSVSNYFFEFIGIDFSEIFSTFHISRDELNRAHYEILNSAIDMYISHVENYGAITTNYTLDVLDFEMETTKFEFLITEEFVINLFELFLSVPNVSERQREIAMQNVRDDIERFGMPYINMNVWLHEGDIVKRTVSMRDFDYITFEFINISEDNERTIIINLSAYEKDSPIGYDYYFNFLDLTISANLINVDGFYNGVITTTFFDYFSDVSFSFYIEVENFIYQNGFLYGTLIVRDEIGYAWFDLSINFSREDLIQIVSLTSYVSIPDFVFNTNELVIFNIGEIVFGFGETAYAAYPLERTSEFAIRFYDYHEPEEVYWLRFINFLRDVEYFVASSSGVLRESLPLIEELIEFIDDRN